MLATEAIVRKRGRVGGEEGLRIAPQHEHRHRIVLEQQPERGLALLEVGDVHAQADDAAVARLPLLDENAAAVGENLLVLLARLVEQLQPLPDPLFLAPGGSGIVAALYADAQGVLETRAHFEEIGAALVDVGIFLIPQDVPPLVVEEHDALREYFERFAQTLVRGGRGSHGGVGEGTRIAQLRAVAIEGIPGRRASRYGAAQHAACQLARSPVAPCALLARLFRHGSAARLPRATCLRLPNKRLPAGDRAKLLRVRRDYRLSRIRGENRVGASARRSRRPMAQHLPKA